LRRGGEGDGVGDGSVIQKRKNEMGIAEKRNDLDDALYKRGKGGDEAEGANSMTT